MKVEIDNAVNFLSNLVRNKVVDADQLQRFREALNLRFAAHFENHWFPEKPLKGNGYRCVRIVNQKMDKTILAAGADAGLTESRLLAAFPPELTVWIDPLEVSYRIGEDGSVGVIYSGNSKEDKVSDDDMESVSSNQSSTSVSRNNSPAPSSGSSLSASPVSGIKDGRTSPPEYYSTMGYTGISQSMFNQAYMLQTVYS